FRVRRLHRNSYNSQQVGHHVLQKGFTELVSVWRRLREITEIRRFLPAFFFYGMGVQTVMIVAAAFGEKVLRRGAPRLIGTRMSSRLVACGGAYPRSTWARCIRLVGVLVLVVCVWPGGCIA